MSGIFKKNYCERVPNSLRVGNSADRESSINIFTPVKITVAFILSLTWLQLCACTNNVKQGVHENNLKNHDSMKLKITVRTTHFTATLFDNATTSAFKKKLPMTINMIELNGNEKYFKLPGDLPSNASNPGTIQTGDLMLYGSNTVVLFYKSFSTSYSYTPIGRVDNPLGLAEALGPGNVTLMLESE